MFSLLEYIQSSRDAAKQFEKVSGLPFEENDAGREAQLLEIYRDVPLQKIRGFGGALTQAAATTYRAMSPENRELFLKACFSGDGLAYTLGRVPIGSCDFSSGNYSYCDAPGDAALESFSLAPDEAALFPFLDDIRAFRGGSLALLASPWSPPAWMKTNGDMCHGGELLPEYYGAWARYIVRYIRAARARGLDIRAVTVQNEPKAVQVWESCVYTAEQERRFLKENLRPALREAGLSDVKIIVWDHNKERAFARAREIFSDPDARAAADGIGFHWYSGDHFENVGLCARFFPEKERIFTEGCVELGAAPPVGAEGAPVAPSRSPWEFGERYAHDMIGNFNNGMNAFLDWNVLLDETGGPNHVGNFCGAPLIYDRNGAKLEFQPSYWIIRHFSACIPAGSQRVAHSCYTSALEACAFAAPDGGCAAVVLNRTEKAVPYFLKDVCSGGVAAFTAPPRSIATLLYRA